MKKVKVKTNQDIKCVDQKEHAEENKYNGSTVKNYRDFCLLAKSLGITQTGDGVKFNDKKVMYIEIDDMIKEMKESV
jgi:arginyl-tRNA synthetase